MRQLLHPFLVGKSHMCFLKKNMVKFPTMVKFPIMFWTKTVKFSAVFVLISSFCRFCYLGSLHVIQQKGFQFCVRNTMVYLKKKDVCTLQLQQILSTPPIVLIIQIFGSENFQIYPPNIFSDSQALPNFCWILPHV